MLCSCSLFLKYRKLSRIFLENLKNSILTVFVPLTTIKKIFLTYSRQLYFTPPDGISVNLSCQYHCCNSNISVIWLIDWLIDYLQINFLNPQPVSATSYSTLDSTATMQQWADATAATGGSGTECTICYERPIDSVLYMCGHMCMCYECAVQQWRGKGGGHCPLCRAVIRDVIRTYKSW